MSKYLGFLLLIIQLAPTQAADVEWTPVVTDLLRQEKTGFGGLCGVVVDHQTGEVWVNLSDRGMFHSKDQGKTWKRSSETQPNGRTETPGCWLLDPTGKTNRMVTALVYGAPLSVSDDRCATWKAMEKQSSHIDWCAVDWTDPDFRFVLALKHEADGLLLSSQDGGKSFSAVGKGYGPSWVFDNQTAVVSQAKSKDVAKTKLQRTTDGGKTFQDCGEFDPAGINSAQALPKWKDGTLYWLVEGALIATTDMGKTWTKVAAIKDAQYGPIFGKNSSHMLVLTKVGPVESTDAGVTWTQPLRLPKELKGLGGLSWLEYDPQHDTLYLMKMGSDLYRFTRNH